MREQLHQGHVEGDTQHAHVGANFNRGCCVLQRLKHGNQDFQCSIGPQALGDQGHEHLLEMCSSLLGSQVGRYPDLIRTSYLLLDS